MNLEISNKVTLVAASSQGLGKALAMGFAEEGARVVICARNIEKLESVKKEIESQKKSEVLAVRTDLTQKEDIENLVAEEELANLGGFLGSELASYIGVSVQVDGGLVQGLY